MAQLRSLMVKTAPSSDSRHYGFRRPPTCTHTSIERAEAFYRHHKSPHHFEHCKDVLDAAMSIDMVEPRVIDNQKESLDRRWANSILANVILYHVLRPGFGTTRNLPPALMYHELRHELDVFSKLMEMERSNAKLADFIPLLNNGSRPPLALLARLVDYSVTHDHADRLTGLVGSSDHSPFRTYTSISEVDDAMKADARAAESIYAPTAELFGYPDMAGTILQHAYRINHPAIYGLIFGMIESKSFQLRLKLTQALMRDLVSQMQVELHKYGFDAVIEMRPMKHPGKLMRKVLRYVLEDFERHEKNVMAPPAEQDKRRQNYVSDYAPLFSLERIHDWVTCRVVLRSQHGKLVDEMPETEKETAMDIAKLLVEAALEIKKNAIHELLLTSRNPTRIETLYEQKVKSNGYNAHHWDNRLDSGNGIFPNTPLSFEIQLMTGSSYDNASNGRAAHHLYIGGDPYFMSTIGNAYHSILTGLLGKKAA